MNLVGRQLSRYRLLERLGTGGMSVVYRGLDTALHREVAVKVLHPHLLQQHGDARRRLEREARAVARLQHPNIVEVFDVADPGAEDAFLVTELVRGETLRAFAERVRCWPPEVGAAIANQVAAALAHAHQAGVVHRDLKPENIMLRDDGVLKLMDFGIARVLDPDERMTQTGALVGSPAYMAPEVIDGLAAGPEADVFAVGTLLYWLWTGALPFTAPSTSAMLKRILDGVYEDPRRRTPALSDALAAILARCLQHRPEDRYPTAAELEAALSTALGEVGLSDCAAQVAAFHLDPDVQRQRLVSRLADGLAERAEAALAAGRTAVALAAVDQLLGLRPEDAVAGSVLRRAQGQQRRQRRRQWLLRGALALPLLLALLGAGVVRWRQTSAVARPQARLPLAVSAPASPVAATSQVAPPSPAPPTPSAAARPAVAAAEKRGSRLESVPVELLVRPYGSVQVDGGPRSRDPLTAHSVQLAPGRHTVRVSCQWCEDSEHVIDVLPGGPQTFALPARLKTAYLSFDFEPKDATVTVAGQRRTSAESLSRPFALLSPRAASRFIHEVAYVVSHPGYQDSTGTVEVLPGQSETLSGKLEPR